MRVSGWPRRAARAVRERAIRVAVRGRGVRRTINGLAVRVDPDSRWFFPADYERATTDFLAGRIAPGSEIWNVGANVGAWAIQLAVFTGARGRVLALEPNPRTVRLLTENIRLNALGERVEIAPLAVGESEGTAELHARGIEGMSRLGAPNPLLPGTTPVPVTVTTLDAMVRHRGRTPDWVFMDVEGWEIPALRAARQLLGHTRFVIELHPFAWPWSGQSGADFEEILHEHGLDAIPITGQADAMAEPGHVFVDAAARH